VPIVFPCSQCGRQLQAPETAAGKQARCPECGAIGQIPAASPSVAEAARLPEAAHSPEAAPFSPFTPNDAGNPYASPTTFAPGPGYATADTLGQELASRSSRLGGFLLDQLFRIVAGAPMFIGIIVMLPTIDRPGAEPPMVALALMGLGILTSLGFAIFNWVLISNSGQSVGKKMVGTRIVKVDTGALPGFLYGVVMRIWVMGLIGAFIGACALVIDGALIFSQERRCLHDYLASTKVIVAR
jgi:uncharacterized RDD family membrane protein YckC